MNLAGTRLCSAEMFKSRIGKIFAVNFLQTLLHEILLVGVIFDTLIVKNRIFFAE